MKIEAVLPCSSYGKVTILLLRVQDHGSSLTCASLNRGATSVGPNYPDKVLLTSPDFVRVY